MDEYIKRADVMGWITSAEMQQKLKSATGAEAYSQIMQFVNALSAADVVAVVRCKECKYSLWSDELGDGRECFYCSAYSGEVQLNDFCSYGERRNEV